MIIRRTTFSLLACTALLAACGDQSDPGTSVAEPEVRACPASGPISPADFDAKPGWKPSVGHPKSCTDADVARLETNFRNDEIATYPELVAGMSASCRSCVLSNDTDPTWGPIVATASDDGVTGFINFGACFGHLDGEACGKALHYEQLCYDRACGECATTAEGALALRGSLGDRDGSMRGVRRRHSGRVSEHPHGRTFVQHDHRRGEDALHVARASFKARRR